MAVVYKYYRAKSQLLSVDILTSNVGLKNQSGQAGEFMMRITEEGKGGKGKQGKKRKMGMKVMD